MEQIWILERIDVLCFLEVELIFPVLQFCFDDGKRITFTKLKKR